MNDFVKNLGIFTILLSVIVIGIYGINPTTDNTLLIIALILLIGGLIGHIVINRFLAD